MPSKISVVGCEPLHRHDDPHVRSGGAGRSIDLWTRFNQAFDGTVDPRLRAGVDIAASFTLRNLCRQATGMRYLSQNPMPLRSCEAMALTVRAAWDAEASVWVAESDDVPGLITEADDLDALMSKLRVMIPGAARG
jgi:hypothetical protein